MKILNLHFKNINSLEGENQINFEQAPFSDTGVFAITGPNGSGKSSILDAITLGLYGETFRFDRPARFVMTQHAVECFAEVEFALGNETYRSSWHVQRAADDPEGELTAPRMRLIRLGDGEILADTSQQVSARITEITGMNFRNFTRSILLAQGDFAAFLTALDSERMDILEKIISTDIYADYKKEVIDKADNAQKMLDKLQQDLAAIPLLDAVKLEACEHDLIDFKEQLAEFDKEQKQLLQHQSLLLKVAEAQKQVAARQKSLEEDKNRLNETQQKLARIDAGENALLFKNDLMAISEKSQAIKQNKAALAALQSELHQLKNRLGNEPDIISDNVARQSFADQLQTIASIKAHVNEYASNRQSETVLWQSLSTQINEKRAALETVERWLEEHAADELLLTRFPETGKLKKLRTELAELTEKQKLLTRQSKKTGSAFKSTVSALDKEQQRTAELTRKLETAEQELEQLAEGNSLEDIDALKTEQQERVKAFRELNQLAQAHQKLNGDSGLFAFLFKSRKEPEPDVDALGLELKKSRQEIKREENIKLALEEAVVRQAMVKKMTADRQHLVDGKPCPLCGALEHPYSKRPPVVANSQQALVDQQMKIKGLLAQADRLEQQIIAVRKMTEKNQANQAELLQLRSQWLGLCNRLNTVSQKLDIGNLKLMKHLLKAETDELENIAAFAAKYRSKLAGIEKLKALINKSISAAERLQAGTRQLDGDRQEKSREQLAIEAALIRQQQEEKELADSVTEQLVSLNETMPDKGQEDALFDRLNSRRQDYYGHAFRRKGLLEELAVLTAKQAACQAEITRCNEQLEIYTGRLLTEEAVGLHLAVIEKQKLIADKEGLLTQQETEIARLHQALQEALQTTQFTSLNEVGEMLELIEHRPELEQNRTELEQAVLLKNTELEKEIARLEAESARPEAALNLHEINIQLRALGEKMELANMEVLHLEKLLKTQLQLQQNYEAVLSQLQHQEEIAQPYLREAALITTESGMEFRRRVQSRMAEQLLSQTNAVLEKVSGRYYLRQIPSEQGLALEVEDTYQGNARRLPKTLSGGESFVVSLALALGLSELANNGKSVDSLFLDEGFGNLDAESLYTVISTLEGLRTHGKIVGVISHVEAVQKRFKAQLHVVKKPNGLGELRKAS